MKEENRSRGSTKQMFKINVDSPLHCPHDLSKNPEFRDDLPTLLQRKGDFKVFPKSSHLEKASPAFSIFDSQEDSEEGEAAKKLKALKFLGPYERYKFVKPFIEAEEAKAAAERKKNAEETKEPSTEDRIANVTALKLSNHFRLTFCFVASRTFR